MSGCYFLRKCSISSKFPEPEIFFNQLKETFQTLAKFVERESRILFEYKQIVFDFLIFSTNCIDETGKCNNTFSKHFYMVLS